VVLSLFGSGPGEGSNASFIDLDSSGGADLRGGIISGCSPRGRLDLADQETFPAP
jgi:hypothetical protein